MVLRLGMPGDLAMLGYRFAAKPNNPYPNYLSTFCGFLANFLMKQNVWVLSEVVPAADYFTCFPTSHGAPVPGGDFFWKIYGISPNNTHKHLMSPEVH